MKKTLQPHPAICINFKHKKIVYDNQFIGKWVFLYKVTYYMAFYFSLVKSKKSWAADVISKNLGKGT
jgi:hypothetical protein